MTPCAYVYPNDKGSKFTRGKQCKKPAEWSVLHTFMKDRKPYVHVCGSHLASMLDPNDEVNYIYPIKESN